MCRGMCIFYCLCGVALFSIPVPWHAARGFGNNNFFQHASRGNGDVFSVLKRHGL